jgi:hypothetical protein
VVEPLCRKPKLLSSNPITAKKKKRRKDAHLNVNNIRQMQNKIR